MKKILSFVVLILSGTFLFAQNEHQRNNNNNAPQQVQESFKKDHPDADNAHWAKSNGRYHASYKHDNRQCNAGHAVRLPQPERGADQPNCKYAQAKDNRVRSEVGRQQRAH